MTCCSNNNLRRGEKKNSEGAERGKGNEMAALGVQGLEARFYYSCCSPVPKCDAEVVGREEEERGGGGRRKNGGGKEKEAEAEETVAVAAVAVVEEEEEEDGEAALLPLTTATATGVPAKCRNGTTTNKRRGSNGITRSVGTDSPLLSAAQFDVGKGGGGGGEEVFF